MATTPSTNGAFESPSSLTTDTDAGASPLADPSLPNREVTQMEGMLLANPSNAVYFGWIRHPATKAWREVVKSFSENRKEYPSWSDEIGQKVLAVLREEKGVEQYFISRRPESDGVTGGAATGSSRSESKKLFDKQKKKVGTWSLATPQEIIDRTKQRFIDDRKPQSVLNGAKRPRGRPPKAIPCESANMVSESISHSLAKAPREQIDWLVKLIADSVKTEYVEKVTDAKDVLFADFENNPLLQQGYANVVLALMQVPEYKEMLVRHLLETESKSEAQHKKARKTGADAVASAAPVPPSSMVPSVQQLLPLGNDQSIQSSSIVVPELKPWFPVMPQNVCFGWHSHSGTKKWRAAVKAFSDDSTQYPEWKDVIANCVKQKLAADGLNVFLVPLDREGNLSDSPFESNWYLASDEDFMENTKLQFIANKRR